MNTLAPSLTETPATKALRPAREPGNGQSGASERSERARRRD